MKKKVITGIMLTLLFTGVLTLAFKAFIVTASPQDTVFPYVFSKTTTYTLSANDGDPVPPHTVSFSDRYNITFSPPDANGVINLTVPMESYYCNLTYDPILNVTWQLIMTSDGYGKMYTFDYTGDVDIKSMTNDSGTFFWKDGAWHTPAEKWIGDGTTANNPAGSSWLFFPINVSIYKGNGTSGPYWGMYRLDVWLTTGFSENTVVEPASRLNGTYMSKNGSCFTGVGGTVTYVTTGARLNIPRPFGLEDLQYKAERSGAPPPAFMATLFSPANLYVTDPENRHIGTDPTTGEFINEIPGAFYTGPGSEPQRVVIPNPLDGVYDVEIIGTSTGTYTLVVELATLTERTTHIYEGNIVPEAILKSQATISEAEITSTTPVSTSGDVNVDGIVDVFDVVIIGIAFGSRPGDPNWNPVADLYIDGLIDIFDFVMMAMNYGKRW